MKKKNLIILFILWGIYCTAQESKIVWQSVDTEIFQRNYIKVINNNSGGYILTFEKDGIINFNNYSAAHKLLWQKKYVGGYYVNDAIQTSDGGYLVCIQINIQDNQIQVLKLDKNGDKEWEKKYTIPLFTTVIQTPDNNYILTGGKDTLFAKRTPLLLKLDKEGNMIWEQDYFNHLYESDIVFNDVVNTPDSGYMCIGRCPVDTSPWSYIFNILLVKIDRYGKMEWQKNYGGSSDNDGRNIINVEDSAYIFSAELTPIDKDTGNSSLLYDNAILIAKADKKGNIIWKKIVGRNFHLSIATTLYKTRKGEYLLVYQRLNYDDWTEKADIFIIKFNDSGRILWEKSYGGNGYNQGLSITELINGNYLLAAYTTANGGDVLNNNNTSKGSLWLVQLRGDDTTALPIAPAGKVKVLINPVVSSLIYQVPDGFAGSVNITNTLGQVVYTDTYKSTYRNFIYPVINTEPWQSGLYILSITDANGNIATAKFVKE